MIQHCETGVAIGSCQLHDINIVNRSAELQIRIGELKYQNKGGGSEAVRQLTNYGFTKLNLQRISLHVFATNIRALRVYEKNGFTREGFLRDAVIINGNSLDVIRMVKLEEADE
jgi:RimJ/RimL family protein N-acetyltransferase